MAISNFALGNDIIGSQCFLNHCEESNDLGSQGSLLQMKQGCSAIDRSTHTTINARKQTNVETSFYFINLTEKTSRLNELLTFQRSVLPRVRSSDPPSLHEILEVMRGCLGLGTR